LAAIGTILSQEFSILHPTVVQIK